VESYLALKRKAILSQEETWMNTEDKKLSALSQSPKANASDSTGGRVTVPEEGQEVTGGSPGWEGGDLSGWFMGTAEFFILQNEGSSGDLSQQC
jgi:hypothetical protein